MASGRDENENATVLNDSDHRALKHLLRAVFLSVRIFIQAGVFQTILLDALRHSMLRLLPGFGIVVDRASLS